MWIAFTSFEERDEHKMADAYPKGNSLIDASDTNIIQIMLLRVKNG